MDILENRLMKPTLAKDAILENVVLPCIVSPKIDGVRAINFTGTITGRSLDPFKGYGITDYFSQPGFIGFDGEMTLGNNPHSDQRLCSQTSGAMGRFKKVSVLADLYWWVFDYVTKETVSLPYSERYALLTGKVASLGNPRINVVPSYTCNSIDEINAFIDRFYQQGYEGTILRNPAALYKFGRATIEGQELWRIKPWSDLEILVTEIIEGSYNGNEAKKNSLGRTERSSSQEGMVPNGQVGTIRGIVLEDFYEPISGKLLFEKGLLINAGSGEMEIEEATYYLSHPEKIVGHIAKIKTMTHGVKDLPRFATYVSHRLPQDMS